MENLYQRNKILDYVVFIDGTNEPISSFEEKDLKFFTESHSDKDKILQPLIDLRGNMAIIRFVGQVITPNCKYISLPKSFTINEKNIDLIIRVINRYQNEKDKNRKDLLINYSYISDKKGELESEAFYFNRLKKFFLNYITYEFIFPKEKLIKHSKQPLEGEIDLIKTKMNSRIYGGGITYKIKDIKNNKEWNLDDIYYTTLKVLSDYYGSNNDRNRIENMKNFLISEGYEMKIDPRIKKEMSNDTINSIIKDIEKIEVDSLHEVIKKTLISYYESEKITQKNTIRAFYTQSFWSVWEYFSQIALYHNPIFKKELEYEGIKQYHSQIELKKKDKETIIIKSGDIIPKADKRPDIFSDYDKGIKFIGDCKYYSNKDSDFDKEMFIYNSLCDNEYPVCIFIPDMKTRLIRVEEERLRNDILELLVFTLSLEEVITDVMDSTTDVMNSTTDVVINKVTRLIKEHSERYKENLKDNEDYYEEDYNPDDGITGYPSGENLETDLEKFDLVKNYLFYDNDIKIYRFKDVDYMKIKSILNPN